MLLRRIGKGNWSPIRLEYDPARQGGVADGCRGEGGARIELFGVVYRVSRVMS